MSDIGEEAVNKAGGPERNTSADKIGCEKSRWQHPLMAWIAALQR